MIERMRYWIWLWVPAVAIGIGLLIGFCTGIAWLGFLVAFLGIAFGVAYAPSSPV